MKKKLFNNQYKTKNKKYKKNLNFFFFYLLLFIEKFRFLKINIFKLN